MKNQRRFAPTGGQFTSESVARFIGISSIKIEAVYGEKSRKIREECNTGGKIQIHTLVVQNWILSANISLII